LITDPVEIARHVCDINAKQYHQAINTPFGSGYLAQTIGLNIEKDGAQQILDGTFHPDPSVSLLPETLRIIDYLSRPCPPGSIPFPNIITPDDFKATYSIVKEKTSSSVSGRHVGHYKAAIYSALLTQVHSSMMSIPYMVGFSPTR
jgi:hypothetical protein